MDDVWDDSADELGATTELGREWRTRRDKLLNVGYREGLEAGKQLLLQQGFDQGFKDGMTAGLEWGAARGALLTLQALSKQRPEILGSRQKQMEALLFETDIPPQQARVMVCGHVWDTTTTHYCDQQLEKLKAENSEPAGVHVPLGDAPGPATGYSADEDESSARSAAEVKRLASGDGQDESAERGAAEDERVEEGAAEEKRAEGAAVACHRCDCRQAGPVPPLTEPASDSWGGTTSTTPSAPQDADAAETNHRLGANDPLFQHQINLRHDPEGGYDVSGSADVSAAGTEGEVPGGAQSGEACGLPCDSGSCCRTAPTAAQCGIEGALSVMSISVQGSPATEATATGALTQGREELVLVKKVRTQLKDFGVNLTAVE